MDNWISQDFEEGIKSWYQKVLAGKEDTLCLDMRENFDLFALQNFFLVCQQMPEKSLVIKIRTRSEANAGRIRHYLYVCKEMAREIWINGYQYTGLKKEALFFKILPLININRANYEFLSTRISDIEDELGIAIGENLLKELSKENSDIKKKLSIEHRCLLQLALFGCYGKVSGFSDFSRKRVEHFSKSEFREAVKNMPLFAFLIFAAHNRVSCIERAKKYKSDRKNISNEKTVRMKTEEMPEAMTSHEDDLADIFNAWDLSDGILQLLENIVEHAGTKQNAEGQKEDGQGVLSMRIHTNSEDRPYVREEYDQYFKGYDNSIREEYAKKNGDTVIERTEKQYFSECHDALKGQVDKGYFVDASVIENYEEVRQKIEARRQVRCGTKYFLDLRIADISGKNICTVFQENLKRNNYPYADDFKDICVKSFFDPGKHEQEKFRRYYQKENIIHHYGLQIFSSVLLNNDGYFQVRSHSKDNSNNAVYDSTQEVTTEMKRLMEGTRYRILLPFHRHPIQERNSMVNADIIYNAILPESKDTEDDSTPDMTSFYRIVDDYKKDEHRKEEVVHELTSCIPDKRDEIIVFDMNQIPFSAMEIFCKAIILYIASDYQRHNNIAIQNCGTQEFVSIIRFFSVCYDKKGMNDWMRHTQVYICGKDTREEFLISGESVRTLLARVEKLAFSRKIHPMCIQILRNILERKGNYAQQCEDTDRVFAYTPFDLILKKDGLTVFENSVKTVLNNNIQNIESGSKISPTHMRLGSKIHLNMFYEAEHLFYNNYYTSRFACLLLKKLREDLKKKNDAVDKTPICLVGYETYSEMLLCELKNMLNGQCGVQCEYVVYENRADGETNLRYKDSVGADMRAVLIVPINTTLTTFNKIKDKVKWEMSNIPILAYLGVVQVFDNSSERDSETCRTEKEKPFLDLIDFKNRCVYSERLLGKDQYAHYLIAVESGWENPIECSQCFPEDCLAETPLIETNKASVVPTQLIGLKQSSEQELFEWSNGTKKRRIPGSGEVETLKNYIYYGHIVRDENHFCYYVRTAAYSHAYKKEIYSWLTQVKECLQDKNDEDKIVFNIIVSPLHFSNAGFAEAVNKEVFNGASYVLRIEAEKEFRDNMQAKYSDLTTLYHNFLKIGNRAEFNFYFVDDNIISGKTFNRAKHLVKSLFNESSDLVRVNIFKAVIVLVNRMSDYSVLNYVESIEDYYAYLDLYISNLRSYEDACFLCAKEKNNRKLANYSSTNIVSQYWEQKRKQYEIKTLPQIKQEELKPLRRERLYQRMLAAHYINKKMTLLGVERNDPTKIYKLLMDQINDSDKGKRNAAMAAYIYAAAFPLTVYRKSCREAVFHMTVILLEMVVSHETLNGLEERIKRYANSGDKAAQLAEELTCMCKASKGLGEAIEEAESKRDFLQFLIKVSAELRCNYIIRPDRMKKVIKRYYNLTAQEENRKELLQLFKVYYVSMVKKLLALSLDGSKEVYFEKTILAWLKGEMQQQRKKLTFEEYFGQVVLALYLENTTTLFEAVKDLYKDQNKYENVNLQEYYLDNYVNILRLNGIETEEAQKNISEAFIDVYSYLLNTEMIKAGSNNLKNEFRKSIYYYDLLAEKVKKLTEAKNVYFFLQNKESVLSRNEDHDVVICDEVYRYEMFAGSDNGVRLPVQESFIANALKNIIMDTVAFEEKCAIIMYKRIVGEEGGSNQGSSQYFRSVYMLIEFGEEIDWRQISKIRRVLVFRDMTIKRLENDFGNSVIQNWIEQTNVIRQLEKARAFTHTKDLINGDMSNVWNISKGFFLGRPSDKEKHEKLYGKSKEGCILELMTDIRIGRINILLLSHSDFREDEIPGSHKFRMAKELIENICKEHYWENVKVCGKDGIPYENQVIEDKIYDCLLEKNKDKKYNCVNDYLSYLIMETIHSAATNGKKEEGKVQIEIYKEGIYLYISNKMDSKDQRDQAIEGLARRGNGISLAVVCEYFITQYDNRFVRLDMEDGKFRIGLPIFEE